MALLGMIQKVTARIGISTPTNVIGNSDSQVAQLLALAQEEGEDLRARFQWSALVRNNTFTITLAASQGALNGTVISDGDYDYITDQTMWNRTTSLPIIGPLNSRSYQTLQAFPVTGPYQQWMLRGKNLILDPVPTSADTAAFGYYSTSFCESSGGTAQQAWAADTDEGLLNESLMTLGIRWRWLKAKGLEYAEDFATYERRVTDAMARDGGNETLSLESRDRDYRQAGIIVPITGYGS